MSERIRLREADVEWRQVEDEVVILDLRRQNYLSVNRSGNELWDALASGTTRDELVAKLVSAFDLDESTAGRDVDSFLTMLDEQELIER